MWAIVTVEMVSQYCFPSYIRDELCILIHGIRYLMVLVYAMSVIMTEYTIP